MANAAVKSAANNTTAMVEAAAKANGVELSLKQKYDNFVGGKFIAPKKGEYFDNISPITGEIWCKAARSTAEDIEFALDAAHKAKDAWGKTSPAERSLILNRIADRMEENKMRLSLVETWDNGKPLRESFAGDLTLAIDHFRYFAAAVRTAESGVSEVDHETTVYHHHEPLGVVGQIIPWNFPLLMAAWKLAPALAAGNCVVMKPAEQTPISIMVLMEIIADLLPEGVVNIVNGFGVEAGKPLAQNKRIAKIAFTGETSTGRLIMQYASENIIPVTLELGGKSPNIFFPDVMEDEELLDKALEGFTMFALSQGQACTCPSRVLMHEKMYDKFIEKAIARVQKITMGNPFDFTTMMGAQSSNDQQQKILSYFDIGRKEGAEVLTGGKEKKMDGDMNGGFYIEPTVFKGNNKMRVFQEEIFGPVTAVTTFKTEEEALQIANDCLYGLAGAVWTRDIHRAFNFARGVQAGRIWINAYHMYPAHAAFGGYKLSGIGRENHKMMLEHYQQTKSIILSHRKQPLGFF